MSFNPYEPPCEYVSQPQSKSVIEGDLSKASRYLLRMGVLSIAYFCVVEIGTVVRCLNHDGFDPALKLLVISVPLVITLMVSLTLSASRLTDHPTRHLRKARWLALLLGTFFFPFLTWPAYVAIRHMTQYSDSRRERTSL